MKPVWACFLLILIFPLQAHCDWEKADAPRTWSFPADYGLQDAYGTQWWYFTGNLRDNNKNRYGYQLTLFRIGVDKSKKESVWDIDDVYAGHLALTDESGERFLYAERFTRTGPGLVSVADEDLDVRVLDWSIKREGEEILLNAHDVDFGFQLHLNPNKPPALHGDNGLSRKGPERGQASYYVSLPRISTTGVLHLPGPTTTLKVAGTSWFDQEFGSNQLAEDQEGWDWFSLHLSDGRDLMLYQLRKKDGSIEAQSSGSLIEPDGTVTHLNLASFQVEVLSHWRSPHSNADYPSTWNLAIPDHDLFLRVEPILNDQELRTGGSTRVDYWEGAVECSGTSGGLTVTGEGYVELTGYAEDLGGLF